MTAINNLLTDWRNKEVLIIGDSLVHAHTNHVVGSASLAATLSTLGANVTLISAIGDDIQGETITKLLEENQVYDNEGVITLSYRPTDTFTALPIRTVKTTGVKSLSLDSEQKFIAKFTNQATYADVILVVDYGQMFTPAIRTWVKEFVKKPNIITGVLTTNPGWYKEPHPTLMMLTYTQAAELLSLPVLTEPAQKLTQLRLHQADLMQVSNSRALNILIEDAGVWICSRGKNSFQKFDDIPRSEFQYQDLTTTTAALSLAFTLSKPMPLIIEPAVKVAQKYWIATSMNQKKSAAQRVSDKIIPDRNTLLQLIARQKQAGKRIVLTNGCFDILHSGHIQYLEQAKAMGDLLIVGVNTDDSIKSLKGAARPVNPLQDRMNVLAGLQSVDYIVSFPETTAVELAKAVRPHVYVKGGDYQLSTLPEAVWVQLYGGEVKIVPYISKQSTTQIIERIRTKPNEPASISTYDTTK